MVETPRANVPRSWPEALGRAHDLEWVANVDRSILLDSKWEEAILIRRQGSL
jgi:hypothetical protein